MRIQKLNMLIFSLIIFTCVNMHAKDDFDNLFEDKASVSQIYFNSTVPGALAGALTGAISAVFMKEYPEWWILNWLVEMTEREAIVNLLSYDMHQKQVPHHKKIMHLSAWAASWVSYLYLKNLQ